MVKPTISRGHKKKQWSTNNIQQKILGKYESIKQIYYTNSSPDSKMHFHTWDFKWKLEI